MFQKQTFRNNEKPGRLPIAQNAGRKWKVTKFTADRFVFSKFEPIYEGLSKCIVKLIKRLTKATDSLLLCRRQAPNLKNIQAWKD